MMRHYYFMFGLSWIVYKYWFQRDPTWRIPK